MNERRIQYVPLSKVKGAKSNPKKHSKDLEKSLGRFGYAEPVLVDERTGRLIAGHGRVEYLRKLKSDGAAPPDGVTKRGGEWLVPVVRGWSSKNDAEAKAYLVASNKLSEAGGWDDGELMKFLASIGDEEALQGLGLSEKDFRKLLGNVVEEAGDETGDIQERFEIVVECKDEKQQTRLLQRLDKEGYTCRSLIS